MKLLLPSVFCSTCNMATFMYIFKNLDSSNKVDSVDGTAVKFPSSCVWACHKPSIQASKLFDAYLVTLGHNSTTSASNTLVLKRLTYLVI